MRQEPPDDDEVSTAAQLAQAAIASEGSHADRVTIHDHGHVSVVAIVDRRIVFKFLRDSDAAVRGEFERFVLDEVGTFHNPQVPRVLGSNDVPPWTALEYLEGTLLNYEQCRAMSPDAQRALGTQIGSFAYELHRRLDLAAIETKRRELGIDQLDDAPWPIHFERVVRDQEFTTVEQDRLAKTIYHEWLRETETVTAEVAIHDDLHADNLLVQNGALWGVLDFGETGLGPPEQELRHTFWMSDLIARSAIEAYEAASATFLNTELVRLWSIMQELAAHSEYTHTGAIDHPSRRRAKQNLGRWFPDINWT